MNGLGEPMGMSMFNVAEQGWQSLSTDSFAGCRRLDEWNRFGSETFCKMEVDPDEVDEFRASISRTGFGKLGLALISATPARASANCAGSQVWSKAPEDCLLLVVPQQGSCSSEQDHRTEYLVPGDLLFRDLGRPWVHCSRENMQLLTLKMPYQELQSRVDDPQRLVGKTLKGSAPEVAISVDLLRSAYRTLANSGDGPWRAALAELMLDSVEMLYLLAEDSPAVQREVRSAPDLRREAMSFMSAHIDDPELSIAAVADCLGVSTRRLQRAFLPTGETPSAWLLNQRLDRAARLLGGAGGESVTEVAFAFGFNELSHFSRSFAHRFGCTPSKYRGGAPLSD